MSKFYVKFQESVAYVYMFIIYISFILCGFKTSFELVQI
jgi:hypothetical protein